MVDHSGLNVAVTGANGFLGRRLVEQLLASGFKVKSFVRERSTALSKGAVSVGTIDRETDWGDLLEGVDTIVHCAARAHVMDDDPISSLEKYRTVNVDGTMRLAESTEKSGVRRFIYISSIKVNGEFTANNRVFSASDNPAPEDAYGVSKLEAENNLTQLSSYTSLEVVIIRPPLVYGPGVKGNIAQLQKAVKLGFPLPFGKISNKRSLVHIDNLIDLIKTCIIHPKAANKVFLVADSAAVSIQEIVYSMKRQLGGRTVVVPVPVFLLKAMLKAIGKSSVADRIFSSLEVDIADTCDVLQWTPPVKDPLKLNWLED